MQIDEPGTTTAGGGRIPRVHPTAEVDETAVLGAGTTVWHLAQI